MYIWNQVNDNQSHYANVGTSAPYNHCLYPKVPCPHHYVKGTVDQGIIFPKIGGSRLQLTVFSDADMAEDIDGRRSTSGMLVFLRSAPISWLPLKQKVVAVYVRGRVRSDG